MNLFHKSIVSRDLGALSKRPCVSSEEILELKNLINPQNLAQHLAKSAL